MRRWLTGWLMLGLAPTIQAADLRHFEDAPLHAVQFVDAQEGWAVGDEGVIWHTINGGESWERQPTGVRASLRAIQFINPFTGYVVGREELPHGGGSVGVVLLTTDGGVEWRRISSQTLPGLQCVRFFDVRNGIVAGDGTDAVPSGIYTTADGGRTWKPVVGTAHPGLAGVGCLRSASGGAGGSVDAPGHPA